MAASQPLIPRKLYRQIASKVPVLCVDLLIWRDNKLLLVKRKNHPLKGRWWVVGGRILLGEEPLDAAYRKAREEAGIELVDPRFIGYYSDHFKENCFEKTDCQTVSLVFVCGAKSMGVKLDDQSSEHKWADGMPERLSRKLKY